MDMCKVSSILNEIGLEREMRYRVWGEQNHAPVRWVSIITEEVGEIAKSINDYHDAIHTVSKLVEYRRELIQIAASAVAAIESLDRNHGDLK